MNEHTRAIFFIILAPIGAAMSDPSILLSLPPGHPFRTVASGEYRPKGVAVHAWELALPVVLEILTVDASSPDHDPDTAMGRRAVLAHYAAYMAAHDPRRLTVETLLDEDVMTQYVTSNPQQARRNHRSRPVALSQLRSFRRSFVPPKRPRRGATPPAGTLPPLTDREFAIAVRAAATFRSKTTSERTRAWLALARGAGLSGADMRWVTADCLRDRSAAGLWVVVERPGAERDVPVLARFADDLRALAYDLAPGALIAAGEAPCDPDAPSAIGSTLTRAVRASGYADLLISVERLRKAWLAEHLAANAPLNTLLAAAGLTSLRSLEDLVANHAPARPSDANAIAGQLGGITGGDAS